MKTVGRRTFFGLLGGAFAAVGLPVKILDSFRSGHKLAEVPGGMTLARLTLTLGRAIPGKPVMSGVNVSANGVERVLWKTEMNNPSKRSSIDLDFRPHGMRLEKDDRLLVYMHNSTVPPEVHYQVAWLEE